MLRKIILALGLAALCASSAWAAPETFLLPNKVDEQAVSAATPLPVTSGSGMAASQVQGTSGAGVADDGSSPEKVGGIFQTTLPNYTSGQRTVIQTEGDGSIRTSQVGFLVAAASATGNFVITPGSVTTGGSHSSAPYGWRVSPTIQNGSGFDNVVSIVGALAAGTGTTAVAPAPTSATAAGLQPVKSAALESCHVLKASAGNLYWTSITIQATSGVYIILDAATAPSAGAVTPIWSQPVISNGTFGGGSWNFAEGPLQGATGLVGCFSSATTPFTYTVSATAMISAGVK